MLPTDEAKRLLPELQVLLLEMKWWDADVQLMGMLKKCGPDEPQALTNILKILQDPTSKQFPDGMMCTTIALRMLGEMGSDAKIAVPTLVDLLKEHRPAAADSRLRSATSARRRREAAPAVELLLAKEGQNDPVLAEKARTALVRMGVFQKKAETPKTDK